MVCPTSCAESWRTRSSAISTASASLLTDAIKGKTPAEADALFVGFHDLVTGKVTSENAPDHLGKLKVFSGVSEFPVRVKCATLAWHTMRAALRRQTDTVTTE